MARVRLEELAASRCIPGGLQLLEQREQLLRRRAELRPIGDRQIPPSGFVPLDRGALAGEPPDLQQDRSLAVVLDAVAFCRRDRRPPIGRYKLRPELTAAGVRPDLRAGGR